MSSIDTKMRRARLLGKECSIVTRKALKGKGTVSLYLEVLSFLEIKMKYPTKLKNMVERLKKAFRDEVASGYRCQTEFPPGYQLMCRGQSRALAAAKVFLPLSGGGS